MACVLCNQTNQWRGQRRKGVRGQQKRNGESNAKSDIDVLVELDETQSLGIFEYSRLRIYLNELLDGSADVVNARTLKPLLRGGIERDAVNAF